MEGAGYIVDSDVLITAKNTYYAFDICPGFWDSLLAGYRRGTLFSIDRVRQEVLMGQPQEDLVQWVKNDVPSEFFLSTADQKVGDAFSQVMLWVQQQPQYYDSARAGFATKADGWLVAYAMTHGVTVATNELASPDSKKEVKLGDVCNAFDVRYENTFSMLRHLQVRYDYRQ